MVVVAVVGIGLAIFCAFKESKLTAIYKANKVYGRITAYLAMDLTLVGILGLLSVFIPAIKEMNATPLLALLLIPGIGLYALAFVKCPQSLKSKCIPSMIISGIGVTMKICVFFLPFVWKMAGMNVSTASSSGIPDMIQDSRGNSCRTRVDGNFLYVSRPDGSEDCIDLEELENRDPNYKFVEVNGVKYQWQ